MKKITIILSVFALALSSCLKDDPNVDFSNLGTVVELVESGKAYFAQDAVTSTKDTVTLPIQVNVASPNPPTSDVTVNLAVDNSIIIADAAIGYITMPTNAYKLSATTVTVKAGQRLANLTLTIYRNLLDPAKSYQLPVKIASTSTGIISGNFGVHYYHIIGNDFAGVYKYAYTRYNNGVGPTGGAASTLPVAGATITLSPVSPTQFEMTTGYVNSNVKYEVTFTKSVSSTGAVTYSNWAVSFDPTTLATYYTANGISVVQQPVFLTLDPINKIFEIQYIAFNGTANRYIIDKYSK